MVRLMEDPELVAIKRTGDEQEGMGTLSPTKHTRVGVPNTILIQKTPTVSHFQGL